MVRRTKVLFRVVLAVTLLVCPLYSAIGQSIDALGSYSPYSMFGVGRIAYEGTAYNHSMGGIGIGMRDNRVINFINPAKVCAA